MRALIFFLFLVGATFWAAAAIGADEMEYPLSIAIDDDGAIYLADRNLPGIWKIADDSRELFFRASKKFRTPLNAVRCVAIDHQGRLVAGDSSTREVYRFDSGGKPQPLTDGAIGIPMDIGVLSGGDLLVSDLEIHRIVRVGAKGGEPTIFAEVPAPRGLFVDKQDRLWIISHGKNQLLRADPQGEIETVVSGRPFQFPHTVVVDEEGVAYVADGYAKAIWKVPPGEKPAKLVEGEPLVNPVGLAIHKGLLYVVDPRAGAVFTVTRDEGKLTKIDSAAN